MTGVVTSCAAKTKEKQLTSLDKKADKMVKRITNLHVNMQAIGLIFFPICKARDLPVPLSRPAPPCPPMPLRLRHPFRTKWRQPLSDHSFPSCVGLTTTERGTFTHQISSAHNDYANISASRMNLTNEIKDLCKGDERILRRVEGSVCAELALAESVKATRVSLATGVASGGRPCEKYRLHTCASADLFLRINPLFTTNNPALAFFLLFINIRSRLFNPLTTDVCIDI